MMPTNEAKPSGSRDYAIGGCPDEIAAVGSVLRTVLRSLKLPHEVYKVRLSDSPDLGKLVRSLRRGRLSALSLSGPLCHEAVRLADEVDTSAKLAGCADTLTSTRAGVLASNTTFQIMQDMLLANVKARATAVVVGSGASACAAVAACQSLDFNVIGVTSRSWTSTEMLHEAESADRLRQLRALPTLWPGHGDVQPTTAFSREMRMQFREFAASANVLIQTVAVKPQSQGAARLASIVPWPDLRHDAVVCDLVYGPCPGPFASAAEQHELIRVEGIEMLAKRGARLIETWTGILPDIDSVRASALRFCMRSVG